MHAALQHVVLSNPLRFIAQAAASADATSFSLVPGSFGARSGDTLLVFAMFEDNSAVTSPAGFTVLLDAEGAASGATARDNVTYGTIADPFTTLTWSYGGVAGVAYAYALWRGVRSVGASANATSGITAGPGADSITVTLTPPFSRVVVVALADFAAETGETATFTSGVAAQASNGAGHIGGRYSMIGWGYGSAAVAYTTTVFDLDTISRFFVELR